MSSKLTSLKHRIGTSLWLAPTAGVVAAFAGAWALQRIDEVLGQDRTAWFLFGGDAESARELLSLIASSMITLTALVFSITVLALQLASGQFSPRVIRNFLRDPATKLAMATFVGTFVYAIMLLTTVRVSPGEFVPALGVMVAVALVLASVAVFINYINRITQSVRAITVLTQVAAETRASIDEMYPGGVFEEPVAEPFVPERAADLVVDHAGAPGVVTTVDEGLLMELAVEADVVIALVPRIGDFVPGGAPLFRVWGAGHPEGKRLRGAVAIEKERTPDRDPAFGFRQLVDVAIRALSPGVNDPTTATQSLDHLHDLVRRLTRRRFPSEARADEHGSLRLVLPRLDYEGYVRLAFEEIREYGSESVQVMRRLRDVLTDCISIAPDGRREVLHAELERATRARGVADRSRSRSQASEAPEVSQDPEIAVALPTDRRGLFQPKGP